MSDKDTKKGPLDVEKDSEIGTTTPPEKEKKETVVVDKAILEKLINTLESQGKKIEILTEVSDKNRLSRVEELRGQGKLVKKVNLNTFEGKIIIGWKKIRDDVYVDEKSRLHEDQVVGLIFLGETKVGKELDLRSFSRLLVKVPAEVIEEGKDRDGNVNLTVETTSGEKIKIDSKFVN